jgi:glycine cleavage system aminomethyltransferase T
MLSGNVEEIMNYTKKETMDYAPYEPIDESVPLYAHAQIGISAYEFTDWRDETMSWKKTCYLHAGLSPADPMMIKGPDVIKFLSRVCVTNFDKFPVGTIKHGVMCNEQGLIIQDGVLVRTGEEEVMSHWMVPLLPYALDSGKYGMFSVGLEYLRDTVFIFQVGGPVSIDVLEAACGQSLRELNFLRFMNASIEGKPVRIYRIGMAGSLSYEAHGAMSDAHDVYNAIYHAGKPWGLRRLGSHCYPMNHSENGYPQFALHFVEPRIQDKDLMRYMEDTPGMEFWAYHSKAKQHRGSAADDINNYYHDPFELGWGKMIQFDHDFVGRQSLEKIAEENKRKMVTLEWNVEDISDIFASQFRDGKPYKYIEEPSDVHVWFNPDCSVSHDKVINENGDVVGMSFGRQNAAYFQRMISICCLDTAYAETGANVTVVWGEPGTRQKHIRAKVTRYPYNNILRNETTDVNTLPKAQP